MKATTTILIVFVTGMAIAQLPKVHQLTIGKKKATKSFSFIHITDTHIGEGAVNRDYGTSGFLIRSKAMNGAIRLRA